MRFHATTLLPILSLFSASARAAPLTQPIDVEYAPTNTTINARSAPQYWCGHLYRVLFSRYMILGRDAVVHEPMLKEAVASTPLCAMTSWQSREEENSRGLNDFDALFHLPIGCHSKLEKKLKELFGADVECRRVAWESEIPKVGLHDDLRSWRTGH